MCNLSSRGTKYEDHYQEVSLKSYSYKPMLLLLLLTLCNFASLLVSGASPTFRVLSRLYIVDFVPLRIKNYQHSTFSMGF